MINKSQVEQNNLKILDSSQVLQNDKNQIIEKLKVILPNIINSDNQLDTRALQDVLNIANTTSNNQGYELTFAGKGIAKAKADELTTKELKVELKQSKTKNGNKPTSLDEFNETENVVIRGDNIDTLKILRANYTNKIKMIYIDPPYNTKNENFVYNDNFKKNEEELIKEFGLAEETQNFLTNVYGTRSHSGWLSFMYPRLKIARELLKEDGVIFISIDDNEQANLKIMCDEIFGEENFVAKFDWRKKTGANDAKDIAVITESIFLYSKNKPLTIAGDIWASDVSSINQNRYRLSDEYFEQRGRYYLDTLDRGGLQYSDSMNFGIQAPDGGIIFPNGRSEYVNDGWIWKWSKEKIKWGIENKYLEFIRSNKSKCSEYTIKYKVYEKVDNEGNERKKSGRAYSNLILDPINQQGSDDFSRLFSGSAYFSNPKPTKLIKYFIRVLKDSSINILDFFAGSGTTGDAVMQLNAEDGGKRKYILAQWDEAIDEKKEAYKFCKDNNFNPVISSITIERLNRAGEKIKADIQAEFDAENSKNKPNQEKLAELREKYVKVFGYEPKTTQQQSSFYGLTVESIENTKNTSHSREGGNLLSKETTPSCYRKPPLHEAKGNLGLDIGYKVFSLKDKPCISEVTNDGGQVSFVPQNLREKTLDTLANMLCATCKPLHTKIETLITDRLYKADNEIYLLGSVDKSQLEIFKDLKINVDGYSDLDLEDFLNLGVTDKDNVSVVY